MTPSPHSRNTGPMLASPRCGAKPRAGHPCRAPAANGKNRCRLHGGARGSGAPAGNRNALKHGFYTKEATDQRRALRRLMRDAKRVMGGLV